MKVIITIPAHNEENNIAKVIEDIILVCDAEKYDYVIHVLNDKSTDKTGKIIDSFKYKKVVHLYDNGLEKGLAGVFRLEMSSIPDDTDIIVHIDADGQYEPKEIPLLINKLCEGYDLILGNRFAGKIESMPFIKRFGNIAFSKVISFMAGKRIGDAQTGFRAFTYPVSKMDINSSYTYTQEQIINAVKYCKYKVCEVPVTFYKRKDSKSKLMRSPFHYAFRAGKDLIKVFHPKLWRGIHYSASRCITAIMGCLILYYFSDKLGYAAWITNAIWIPISFFVGFFIMEYFVNR